MPSFNHAENSDIHNNHIFDAKCQINYIGCTIYGAVDHSSCVLHLQSTELINTHLVQHQEDGVFAVEGSQCTKFPLLRSSLVILQQIERVLRAEAGPLNTRLQFQLDSLSHTLYLINLAVKIARSTPLADSLYRFIRPHVDKCHSLLQQIFDMIDQYRVGLLPFKIWFLWQKIYVWANEDGHDIDTVQRELQSGQHSLDKILLALKSVVWTGLSTDAIAGFPAFRAFLVYHYGTPSLRHIQLPKIVVVDHLGVSLPIPLEFCSSLQDINYLLLGYCQNRIGMQYIQDGDYQLLEPKNSKVVSTSEIARKLKPGTVLEMSIILRQLQSIAGIEDPKKLCPRCHHLNPVIANDGGWIQCTKCSGKFTVSVANAEKAHGDQRPRDDVPSPKIVAKCRYMKRPRAEKGMQCESSIRETQFFRRIHVHLTMSGVLAASADPSSIMGLHSGPEINKRDVREWKREAEKQRRRVAERLQREQARKVILKRNQMMQMTMGNENEWMGHDSTAPLCVPLNTSISKGKQAALGSVRQKQGVSGEAANTITPTTGQYMQQNNDLQGNTGWWDNELEVWQYESGGGQSTISSSDVHTAGRMSTILGTPLSSDFSPPRIPMLSLSSAEGEYPLLSPFHISEGTDPLA